MDPRIERLQTEALLRSTGWLPEKRKKSAEELAFDTSPFLFFEDYHRNEGILDPMDKKKTKCAYGDDPKDQNEIKRGIMYARMLGYTHAG